MVALSAPSTLISATLDSFDEPVELVSMVTLAVPETVNSKYPLSAFPISVEVTAVTSEFVLFVSVPFAV